MHKRRLYGMEHSYIRPWYISLSGLVLKRNKKKKKTKKNHKSCLKMEGTLSFGASSANSTFNSLRKIFIHIYIYIYV